MRVIRATEQDFVAASHEDPNQPGVLKRVLAQKHELMEGRVQMINWARLPAGSTFRPHYHEDMQEVFIILNGDVRLRVGNQQVDLSSGDAVVIDPREVHEMRNTSNQEVDYIVAGISQGRGGQTVVV